MSDKIVLVTESGLDVPPDIASRYNIYIVPMIVTVGDKTYPDDDNFPEEIISEYLHKTGKTPKTSAPNPADFEKVYDEIHAKYPDAAILHVAYSSVTTASFNSSRKAAEGRDYVTLVDTKHVSFAGGSIVVRLAQMLEEDPTLTVDGLVQKVHELRETTRLYFLPYSLSFLKAGGRLTNGAALIGKILHILPCIETKDGVLVATRKYRGNIRNIAPKMVREVCEQENIDLSQTYLLENYGQDPQMRSAVEAEVRRMGFGKFIWTKVGATVSAHCGPGAFGMVVSCRLAKA